MTTLSPGKADLISLRKIAREKQPFDLDPVAAEGGSGRFWDRIGAILDNSRDRRARVLALGNQRDRPIGNRFPLERNSAM